MNTKASELRRRRVALGVNAEAQRRGVQAAETTRCPRCRRGAALERVTEDYWIRGRLCRYCQEYTVIEREEPQPERPALRIVRGPERPAEEK